MKILGQSVDGDTLCTCILYEHMAGGDLKRAVTLVHTHNFYSFIVAHSHIIEKSESNFTC